MSGTPRCVCGIVVLPAGSESWKAGRAKMWLKPPPESIQPISCCCWCWQLAGGETLSSVRVVVFVASVHRYVPPTPVTSGSEAGHPTVGVGIVEPPLPTGAFLSLAEPPSPEEASTVTPFAAAALKASRRFSSDCLEPNASSAEPKLWEMTSARGLSPPYFSAAIICGKPCTPSVSAVGVWTSRMLAPGAIACAISTSSATSSAQAALFSWPVPLLLDGGALVAGEPCSESSLNFGMPAAHVTPSSPHIEGSPNVWL